MTSEVVAYPDSLPRHPGGTRLLVILIAVAEAAMLVGWLTHATSSSAAIIVFLGVTAAVGGLLSLRVPANPIGWLMLAIAGLWLVTLPLEYLGEAVRDTNPTLAGLLLWYAGDSDGAWAWLPPIGLTLTQLLLLFPDGKLPSPRWRRLSLFTIASLTLAMALFAMTEGEAAPGLPNPIGWISEDSPINLLVLLLLIASFTGCAASLVVRYRRAGVVQRAQIKWVALAGGIVVGLYAASLIDFAIRQIDWGGLEAALVLAAFSLIPLSIGVAVLKFRLYEIDRIVSRTVSYLIVTLLVLGTYALVVTSVSRLLPQSSELAVAGATLAAAAVFRPVLQRVRDTVDRRFNRARFDAVHEVDAFAARLRDSVDPEVATADLAYVVQRTLQPAAVGLWTIGARR